MNNYLIISSDSITINETINKIIKDNGVEEIIKYDLEQSSINDLIENLDTYSLFSNKKAVIGLNAYFLGSSKQNKNQIEHDTTSLEKYLINPSDNILILVCEKVDNKKKITKLVNEKSTCYSNDIKIEEIIKKRLDGFKMDNYTINYLINYCNNDNLKILNELEKLKSFKLNEKIIIKEDIDNIVMKSFSDNVFSLVDAFSKKNKTKIYSLYQELTDNGEDTIKIVALLQDQYRMMYNGRLLLKEYNNNYDQVADILGFHPYRFRKAIEASFNYRIDELFNLLKKICDVELSIKTGIDPEIAFTSFVCNI